MSTSSFSSSHADVIDLQQQVARSQGSLQVSRQVHAAVHQEVLQSVLRIVVRELEMAGAHVTEPALSVGDMPRHRGMAALASPCSAKTEPS